MIRIRPRLSLTIKAQQPLPPPTRRGKFDALAKMAYFPSFMLICYVALFVYFKSKGGYEAEVLTGHEAKDEEYTGGVEGPADA